jgi:hypothetical protein
MTDTAITVVTKATIKKARDIWKGPNAIVEEPLLPSVIKCSVEFIFEYSFLVNIFNKRFLLRSYLVDSEFPYSAVKR